MSEIASLLTTDLEKRDAAWETAFTQALPLAKLTILDENARVGPDGWPYLFVEVSEEGKEPAVNVIHWLSTHGIGLAVNPEKDMPDFVLTYGMIWNFRERGEFLTLRSSTAPADSNKPIQSEIRFEAGTPVLVGAPTQAYLPKYVRTIIKQFLFDQGVLAPKVLVMLSPDQKNADLCFSIESLDNPAPTEFAGIAEAIAWFLPAHYSVTLLSEKTLSGFENL